MVHSFRHGFAAPSTKQVRPDVQDNRALITRDGTVRMGDIESLWESSWYSLPDRRSVSVVEGRKRDGTSIKTSAATLAELQFD